MGTVMNTLANVDQKQTPAAPVVSIHQGADLMSMLFNAATNSSLDIDKLQRLIDLKERNDKLVAEQQFNAAVAAYKLNEPVIVKNGKAEFVNSRNQHVCYSFARLSDITEAVKSALARQGLSFRWDFAEDSGRVSVTCWLQHAGGHAVSCTASGAPDTSGSKNPLQSVASTKTYLERMTLLSVLGMSAVEAEQEDDQPQVAADKSRIDEIVSEMNATVTTLQGLTEFMQQYSELPDKEYAAVNAAAEKLATEIRAKKRAAQEPVQPAETKSTTIMAVPEINPRFKSFSGRMAVLAGESIEKAINFYQNQLPAIQEEIKPMLDYLQWKDAYANR
jgi:hypothetical protein